MYLLPRESSIGLGLPPLLNNTPTDQCGQPGDHLLASRIGTLTLITESDTTPCGQKSDSSTQHPVPGVLGTEALV